MIPVSAAVQGEDASRFTVVHRTAARADVVIFPEAAADSSQNADSMEQYGSTGHLTTPYSTGQK